MRIRIIALLCYFCLSAGSLLHANQVGNDSLNFSRLYIPSPFPKTDPMLARLDSLTMFTFSKDNEYFGNTLTNLSPYDPHFTDEEIRKKLNQIPALFPMTYNSDVKTYINYFTQVKRGYTSRMLGLCEIYFPMFEELLDKKKMPMELKYLPVIESAFNPLAVSRVGATGMWQIMYKTGRVLNLDMNSYIDERMDPRRSTEAAVNYLQQLYGIYGDWQLALAAYNAGPGNVNKAIANAGGVKNFWAVKPFLPMETQNYVPSFIGMVYAMTYAKDYKIYPTKPLFNPTLIDTVMISDRVSLKHIVNTIGIDSSELHFLNPSLKLGIIPSSENGFPLRLPVGYLARFEDNRTSILNDPSMQYASNTPIETQVWETVPRLLTHVVRAGESISTLARKYAVSVTDIKKWNRLKSTSLYKGQKITIKTTATKTVAKTVPAKTEETGTGAYSNSASSAGSTSTSVANSSAKVITEEVTETVPKTIYHTVRSGESLYGIASKYGVNVNDIKIWNRLKSSTVYRDQKLAIKTFTTRKVTRVVTKPAENTEVGSTPASVESKSSETVKNNPVSGIKYVLHTVQKGETLQTISQLYTGSSIESIKGLNNLSGDEVKPGTVLKIQI